MTRVPAISERRIGRREQAFCSADPSRLIAPPFRYTPDFHWTCKRAKREGWANACEVMVENGLHFPADRPSLVF